MYKNRLVYAMFWRLVNTATVEPRLSGLAVFFSENGRVPQMCMRVAAITMETCLLIFCACADNHMALLFINKVGGSRRGLSIRLSGIFTYPACFWNQGVRIIEVLLYSHTSYVSKRWSKWVWCRGQKVKLEFLASYQCTSGVQQIDFCYFVWRIKRAVKMMKDLRYIDEINSIRFVLHEKHRARA